jgi:hypothetical protein
MGEQGEISEVREIGEIGEIGDVVKSQGKFCHPKIFLATPLDFI